MRCRKVEAAVGAAGQPRDLAEGILGDRIMATVLAQGLREYYDPYTGRGMGAVDFGWSTLVMEMLTVDQPTAAASYLNRTDGTG